MVLFTYVPWSYSMLARHCYPVRRYVCTEDKHTFWLRPSALPIPALYPLVPAQEITHDPMNSMVNYRSSLCFILQE